MPISELSPLEQTAQQIVQDAYNVDAGIATSAASESILFYAKEQGYPLALALHHLLHDNQLLEQLGIADFPKQFPDGAVAAVLGWVKSELTNGGEYTPEFVESTYGQS